MGIYFVMNGFPTKLCFISAIWNVCLKGLFKSLVCSIVRAGTRIIVFFCNLLYSILVLICLIF